MKKKTLLIPDIPIYKSPLAVHRLPMRGFTAQNTLPPGSHRASTGVSPSVHGISGPETGCMPYPSHGVPGTASVSVTVSIKAKPSQRTQLKTKTGWTRQGQPHHGA